MRVISINVNGIHNAIEQGLFDWLQQQNADVICLQDTQVSAYEMEGPDLQLHGYYCYACDAEQPTQGGVAIYTRLQPKAIISYLGFEAADRFGRYIQADFDKVSVASVFMPSGRNGDVELNQKFKFMEDFGRHLDKQHPKRRDYIYCASLFIAHNKLDVKHWRDCQQEAGFLPAERAWMDEVIGNMGFIDALREVNREGDLYSWWADSEQARMLDLGWRFDYQLLSPGLKRTVRSAKLCKQTRFSQHAPFSVDYDWVLTV